MSCLYQYLPPPRLGFNLATLENPTSAWVPTSTPVAVTDMERGQNGLSDDRFEGWKRSHDGETNEVVTVAQVSRVKSEAVIL